MGILFLYGKWTATPISTRTKIAAQFGIQKKRSTHVANNEIIDDGYVIKEIEEALNIDALQKYLGTSETDMLTLWLWMVDKIEGREQREVNIDTTVMTKEVGEVVNNKLKEMGQESIKNTVEYLNKPKRGRPRKTA